MHKVTTIFSELLKLYPRYQFEKAVHWYQGDRYVKIFTTQQQYITILYSQIKQKDSLRDIETGLMAQASRWYHLGLANIRKSTLSDANNRRDYRIFEEMFYHLLSRCKDLTPKHKFRFKNPLYTIDATTIDLCLSVFPWAKFRKAKGAIKMHCLYAIRSKDYQRFMLILVSACHCLIISKEGDSISTSQLLHSKKGLSI